MKQPGVIIQEVRHEGTAPASDQEVSRAIELSAADFNEILRALLCRRTPRSQAVIDKLTKAFPHR